MAIVNSRAAIEPKTGKAAIFVNETIPSLMRKLFSNGEQGFFYDPNDLSTMYQDAAGTIPVTAVGQPVGLMKDKSGRNNHAFQTTSASRPILRKNATTGAYYLAFDGVDDCLQTNNIDFTATDKVSLFAGVNVLNTNSEVRALLDFGERNIELRSKDGIRVSSLAHASAAINANQQAAVLLDSPSYVVVAKHSVPDKSAYIKVGTTTNSITGDKGTGGFGNHVLFIGRRTVSMAGNNFLGNLYGLIGIGRLTTDSETIALEKAIAKNTGVTLNV
ncbi:hypothetical protein LZ086_18010 [Acinetobacter johnsonii]|nr:hypothetical protein LZ086_18010 [Acinetobacter johnsonii]